MQSELHQRISWFEDAGNETLAGHARPPTALLPPLQASVDVRHLTQSWVAFDQLPELVELADPQIARPYGLGATPLRSDLAHRQELGSIAIRYDGGDQAHIALLAAGASLASNQYGRLEAGALEDTIG